jgi:pSer/pThr/pTyr-binding forkhead associated (FHA) protein
MAAKDASRRALTMWILRSADDDALTFRLPRGSSRTLGRARGADFVLDAALVSRLHCRLTARDERLDVEDLSSTNGTFVNNKRVEKGHAGAGDRLRIGRVELKIEQQLDDERR